MRGALAARSAPANGRPRRPPAMCINPGYGQQLPGPNCNWVPHAGLRRLRQHGRLAGAASGVLLLVSRLSSVATALNELRCQAAFRFVLRCRPDFLLRQSQEPRGRRRSLSAFDFAAHPVSLFRRACRSDQDSRSRVADFRDLDCPGWRQIVLSSSSPTSPKKARLAHQRGAVRRPGHFRQPGRLGCSYRLAVSAVRLAGSCWDSVWPLSTPGLNCLR